MVLYTDKNRRYFKIQLIIFMCEVKNVNDIGRSLHFIKKYFLKYQFSTFFCNSVTTYPKYLGLII